MFLTTKSELTHTDFSNRWFVAGWDQCHFKRTSYNQRRTQYNGFKTSYPMQVNRKFLYYIQPNFHIYGQ